MEDQNNRYQQIMAAYKHYLHACPTPTPAWKNYLVGALSIFMPVSSRRDYLASNPLNNISGQQRDIIEQSYDLEQILASTQKSIVLTGVDNPLYAEQIALLNTIKPKLAFNEYTFNALFAH